jgi:HPt (histidine-containing phosphotransfer) domain-containing protein
MTSDQAPFVQLSELKNIPVLDQSTLDLLREIDDGGLDLTKEMFGMFEADQPPRLEALHEALESSDMTRITEISHTIKGSAGTMGAMRLRATAAILEFYGRTSTIESSPAEVYALLTAAYTEVHDALHRHIASG